LTVINADIGPSPIYIFITTAGSLITGVGLLVVGRLGDIVGRRYFLIGGQLTGIIAGIISAKATSVNMLIAGSVLLGFSQTAQLTFPYVIQELVPNKHRGYAQAAMIVGVIPFAGFGPVIARSLIENTALGWRWCYWLNVIACGLSFILLTLCYFPPNLHQLHSKLTWQKELRELDYGGIVLYGAGQLLILLGLAWGGAAYSWTSAHVLGTLVLGCVLIVLFALYEVFMPLHQPLLPMKILKNKNYIAVVIAGSVGQMVFFALSILWPQQIAALYTTDNVKIGWMSCTSGLALAVGEIVMGPLLKPLGHTKLQLIFSAIGLTAFLGAMGASNQNTMHMAIAFTILAGFFTGWLELVVLVANGLVNLPQDLGLANGFLGSVRNTAGTISISIYVAILERRLAVNLPQDVTAAAVSAGLPTANVPALFEAIANGTATAMSKVPGINTKIEGAVGSALQDAYSQSFRTVYLASIAFGACAIIACFFSGDIDQYLTNYVSRRIQKTVATQEGIITEKAVQEQAEEA